MRELSVTSFRDGFAAALTGLNIGAADNRSRRQFETVGGYSDMKTGTIKALPSAASVQRAVGPISGQHAGGAIE